MIKILMISFLTAMCVPISQEWSSALAASISSPGKTHTKAFKERELKVLNNELESLVNLKDYYVAKMTRYRNRASRLEFQEGNLEVSKLLALEADKIEGIVKQIEEEIGRLEQLREKLLKG